MRGGANPDAAAAATAPTPTRGSTRGAALALALALALTGLVLGAESEVKPLPPAWGWGGGGAPWRIAHVGKRCTATIDLGAFTSRHACGTAILLDPRCSATDMVYTHHPSTGDAATTTEASRGSDTPTSPCACVPRGATCHAAAAPGAGAGAHVWRRQAWGPVPALGHAGSEYLYTVACGSWIVIGADTASNHQHCGDLVMRSPLCSNAFMRRGGAAGPHACMCAPTSTTCWLEPFAPTVPMRRDAAAWVWARLDAVAAPFSDMQAQPAGALRGWRQAAFSSAHNMRNGLNWCVPCGCPTPSRPSSQGARCMHGMHAAQARTRTRC